MEAKPFELAICLSGGGYKAALFHLGTLSYLNHLNFGDEGAKFLDFVNVISTISGGSITGLWYMMNLCKGIDTDESFTKLYELLVDTDIPHLIGKNFNQKKYKNHSLVCVLADVYDKVFFHDERFGLILDNVAHPLHVHQFTANSTDFTNAMPFHFQATRRVYPTRKGPNIGIIGNEGHRIPLEIGSHLRLADIAAASSCFPGPFEPLVFPNDFHLPQDTEIQSKLQDVLPFGLMDGGILDNQGSDPIPIAESQMGTRHTDEYHHSLDLVIVSDVSNPFVKEPYHFKSPYHNFFGRLSLSLLLLIALVILLVSITFIIVSTNMFWLGFMVCFLLVGISIILLIRSIIRPIPPRFSEAKKVLEFASYNALHTMFVNRCRSINTLSKCLMKQIRKKSYDEIYNVPQWKNRFTTNILYLSKRDGIAVNKLKGKDNQEYLLPSSKIYKITEVVDNIKATLSFTREEKRNQIPKMLVAAGHYSICWNLLRYINELKNDSNKTNMNTTHNEILKCEQQLLQDWEHFKQDPYWLYDKVVASSNKNE